MDNFLSQSTTLYVRSTLFAVLVTLLAFMTPFLLNLLKSLMYRLYSIKRYLKAFIGTLFAIYFLAVYVGILTIGGLFFAKSVYWFTSEAKMKGVTNINIHDDKLAFVWHGQDMSVDISQAEVITYKEGDTDTILVTQASIDLSNLKKWMITPNLKQQADKMTHVSRLIIYYANIEK